MLKTSFTPGQCWGQYCFKFTQFRKWIEIEWMHLKIPKENKSSIHFLNWLNWKLNWPQPLLQLFWCQLRPKWSQQCLLSPRGYFPQIETSYSAQPTAAQISPAGSAGCWGSLSPSQSSYACRASGLIHLKPITRLLLWSPSWKWQWGQLGSTRTITATQALFLLPLEIPWRWYLYHKERRLTQLVFWREVSTDGSRGWRGISVL